jgi:hypothetical protein
VQVVNISSSWKPAHVATSGFWKPCHDCTSGWQENEQELVNFFIEAVSKSVFKYVKNYDIKNLKTVCGPIENTD